MSDDTLFLESCYSQQTFVHGCCACWFSITHSRLKWDRSIVNVFSNTWAILSVICQNDSCDTKRCGTFTIFGFLSFPSLGGFTYESLTGWLSSWAKALVANHCPEAVLVLIWLDLHIHDKLKGIDHRKRTIHSLSTHHYVDGGSVLRVFELSQNTFGVSGVNSVAAKSNTMSEFSCLGELSL